MSLLTWGKGWKQATGCVWRGWVPACTTWTLRSGRRRRKTPVACRRPCGISHTCLAMSSFEKAA
eukprot:972882-Alexandrium_andersonii.AAC.1